MLTDFDCSALSIGIRPQLDGRSLLNVSNEAKISGRVPFLQTALIQGVMKQLGTSATMFMNE